MDPRKNVGNIVKALEKFYNTRTGSMDVKARPVLIIGCEDTFHNPLNIDYEILPFSEICSFKPDINYDIHIDSNTIKLYNLTKQCYLRSHKTSWIHSKNIRLESPICNLYEIDYELFQKILELNNQWNYTRTCTYIEGFGN
ncbi:hypothetical protein CR203_06450 [Salipaludibacillus neizhouensis]|uniref:Uncharacterized protein n=1 Tax=Salipaludibacillus neizhouensis TaxID=885475 RepID=A0A3A9K4Z3_9BACI|nr:hypothetical protein CR203_06450 [Salipaludibacillus neizhouensis]